MSAEAARLIADAARRHGNGHIDLTSRANLQIRGLSPRSAQAFAETIIAAGLASANPSLEAIRNVMASPLGPDDPSAAFDSHAVARDIEAMLAGEPALWALPSKFGILVDGGGVLPLARHRRRHHGPRGGGPLAVQLDGGTLAALCSPATVAEDVKALALAFLRLSAQRSEPPRRMRALVMAVGEEAIFAEAGLTPPACLAGLTPEAKVPIGLISLGYRGTKRLRRWAAFRPHRSQCVARARRHLGALRRRKLAHHALARAAADRRCRADIERACATKSTRSDSSPIPPTRASTSSPASARRPARAPASMRAPMPAALPPSSARRAATPSIFLAASNPAPIAAQRRSRSSAATGATISSATVAPPTGRA